MLGILGVTSPIYLLIGLGFASVRLGLLAKSDMRPLGTFVIHFAMPALLFKAMTQRALAQGTHMDLVSVYLLGSLGVAVLCLFLACVIRKQSLQSGAVLAMGMSVSNSAYVGYPIAQQVFGAKASAALATYVGVESMIMLPLLMTLAELGGSGDGHWLQTLRSVVDRLMRNQMLLAIFAGLICAGLEIPIPRAISRTVDMLSTASAPVALFYIGGILAGLDLKEMASDIGIVMIGKLVLHPLMVFFAFLLIPIHDPAVRTAAIMNAAMPMMSIYPILGQKYGREGSCTAALVAATVVSFFTISALLWLWGADGMLAPGP